MTTYATLARTAEQVTVAELVELIRVDNNFDVFPGPRRPRRIAFDAIAVERSDGRAVVFYGYCNRLGGGETGNVRLGQRHDRAIFRFRDGRTVQAVPACTCQCGRGVVGPISVEVVYSIHRAGRLVEQLAVRDRDGELHHHCLRTSNTD